MSYLLFVEDTLFLFDNNLEQLEYLSWAFMWLDVIFGLKINMEKVSLFL